jgi:hypothetical protein
MVSRHSVFMNFLGPIFVLHFSFHPLFLIFFLMRLHIVSLLTSDLAARASVFTAVSSCCYGFPSSVWLHGDGEHKNCTHILYSPSLYIAVVRMDDHIV